MDERTQTSEPQVEVEEPVEGQPEEPIEETDEYKDWDKEKSVKAYKKLQRKITEREKAAKEAEREKIKLEEKLKLLEEQRQAPQERVDVPKKPAPLPPKPNGFRMEDIFDPATASAQWWALKLDRDVEMDRYMDYREQVAMEKERQQAEAYKAQQQYVNLKNERISQLQGAGATLNEAMEIFDVISSEKSVDPNYLLGYGRYIKEQELKSRKPKASPKPSETQSPATVGSGKEEAVNRQEYTRANDNSWMYKIKK